MPVYHLLHRAEAIQIDDKLPASTRPKTLTPPNSNNAAAEKHRADLLQR
jgi:hypothetical protein